jgi:hypothetical protein
MRTGRTLEQRWAGSVAAFMVAALVLTGACSPRSDPSKPVPPPRAVPVPAGTDSSTSVTDAWTVQIPAGAVPENTSITISTDLRDVPAVPNEIARAAIGLTSGQPQRPLAFTYRLAAPVPSGSAVYLIGRGASAGELADSGKAPPAAIVLEAQLSADRLTATATVPHLSVWQWVTDRVDDADHFLASLVGQRGTAPTCETQPRPAWMDKVIYLDDQNAPLRVCTGADPNNHDIAVVKIRNNRAGAMVVTAPVTPQWASAEAWDGRIDSVITDILTATIEPLGVPPAARSRSWILPPGGGVDIGFTRESLDRFHGTSTIATTFSTASAAYGLIWSALGEAVSDHTTLTALEMGIMTACVDDAARSTVDAATVTELLAGVSAIVTCAVEKLPDVLAAIKANVPASVWTGLVDKGLYRAATAVTTKLVPLLTIGKSTMIVGDLASTLALPTSAFEITLFTALAGGLPDTPPTSANCDGNIVAHQDIRHPNLGAVRIFLVLKSSQEVSGHGCVVLAAASGKTWPTIPVDVYGDELHFYSPATDSTGNTFIEYNPGRYDGVLVLVPDRDGFEDIGWADQQYGTRYQGRRAYYYATAEGPGADGRYTIRQSRNNCTPTCAEGAITSVLLHWNGHDYVP